MDPLYDQIATYPCIVQTFPNPILYLAGLNTTWEHSPKKPVIYHQGQEMDFRNVMLGGVDGELNFLPTKVASEVPARASKVVGEASTPLDVDIHSDIYELEKDRAYAELERKCNEAFQDLEKNPLVSDMHAEIKDLQGQVDGLHSEYSRLILEEKKWACYEQIMSSLQAKIEGIEKQLCDIHDRAYMRQVVLDNLEKDRAYAELERKCNEALQDLEKNPLVSDMHVEIKDLQGQVDGLHSEYSRLILEEKKWACYEQIMSSLRAKIEGIESERERLKSSEIKLLQEIDSLKQDRSVVVSKVVPDAAMKLIRSDDLGVLIAKLVRSSIIYGRCQAFEEVAAMEEPFVLENTSGYRPSSKEEYGLWAFSFC
ncbi:hypothetical protein Tco_0825724 [Tanacetum coccineum]